MKLVEKSVKGKWLRDGDCSTEDDDGPPEPKWQCTLVSKPAISAVKLQSLMLEYTVEDMLPLSTVDSSTFRKWYSTQVPGRNALT